MVIAFAACDGAGPSAGSPDRSAPAGPTCPAHAEAWDGWDGTPGCRCLPGYLGIACDVCAGGYHAAGDTCVADPPRPTAPTDPTTTHPADPAPVVITCGPHGYATGAEPPCVCQDGYAGPTCEDCAEGYVFGGRDDDANPLCVMGCALGAYACDGHGRCVDGDAGPTCACDAGFVSDGATGCVPTAGATCATAIPLALGGHAETTTLGGSPALAVPCRAYGLGSQARVLSLELAAPRRVRVAARGSGVSIVALASACGEPDAALACDDTWDGGTVEADLPAGTTTVVVETWGPFGGPVAVAAEVVCPAGEAFAEGLDVCVPDPCAAAPCQAPGRHVCTVATDGRAACACDPGTVVDGDGCAPRPDADGSTCATALTLTIGKDLSQTIPAPRLRDRSVASCAYGEPASRLFATLALDTASRVRVRAPTSYGGPLPVLSLRAGCDDATRELVCAAPLAPDLGTATGAIVAPGVYTIVVDGLAPGGDAALAWDVTPDPCVGLACAGGTAPERAVDWSTCACACPSGLVWDEAGATCVADPCRAAACPAPTTRCVAHGAVASCACPPDTRDTGREGDARCAPDPAAAEWTVVVYESLDNNLASGFGGELGAMARDVPAGAPVDVVWLAATPAENAVLRHVGHGEDLAVIDRWDRPDMGDWRTLRALGAWAVAHYPARHYALVLVDHGGGLELSWDVGAGDTFMSLPGGGFAEALATMTGAAGRPLDLVDFAMCLMSRWEVGEVLRPYARAFAGSPELSYGLEGHRVPALVAAAPEVSPRALAEGIVASAGDTWIESWFDLGAWDALTTDLDRLAGLMLADLTACPTYDDAATDCFPFATGEADLGCFATALAADASLPADLRAAADDVAARVEDAAVTQPGTSGLAIYLPELALPSDAPAEARALADGWVGPGSTWLGRARWDELLTACRAR